MVDLQIVTNEALEHELCLVRTSAMSSRSGIFGPQSAIWRIDREAAIFLGAGRALLSSSQTHLKIEPVSQGQLARPSGVLLIGAAASSGSMVTVVGGTAPATILRRTKTQ